MKTISTELFHLIHMPVNDVAEKHPLLILVHGMGADEEDLFGLVQFLDERFLVLSVRAPYPFPFSGGYTWYDLGAIGAPDPAKFKVSYEKLLTFVRDAVTGYPVDPSQVYLYGFSMGTVMSLALALTRPELIAGVVGNSGYIAEDTHLEYKWKNLADVNFFLTHGMDDPLIPIQFARRVRDLFEKSNAQFIFKEYPMAHEISQESLMETSAWLTQQLDNHQ